jgi:hypothetical protein
MESYKTREKGSSYLLELSIFMASSARDVTKFKHYGTVRLLRSLYKLLDLPNHIEIVDKDEFFEEIKKELARALEDDRSLTRNEEALTIFLDQLIIRMLKEYRRRLTTIKLKTK